MGNRIKLRRKELHFKQADLAELLEISNNHMSAIERGREKPSLDTFISICQALKSHQTTYSWETCTLSIFHRILSTNFIYAAKRTSSLLSNL